MAKRADEYLEREKVKKEPIIIEPKFIPRIPRDAIRFWGGKRFSADNYARCVRKNAASNSAIFYTELYRGYNRNKGITSEEEILRRLDLEYVAGFRPDYLRVDEDGFHCDEIKCSSESHYRFWISQSQITNYLNHLLKRSRKDESPSSDFVFFRNKLRRNFYSGHAELGLKNKREKGITSIEDHTSLVENLCTKTSGLLVMPVNLALSIFLTDPSLGYYQLRARDHSSSEGNRAGNYEFYYVFPGSFITRLQALANGNGNLVSLESFVNSIKDNSVIDNPNILGLDGIVMEREEFPDDIWCSNYGWDTHVGAFPITRFKINRDANKEWLKQIRRKRNSEKIAEAIMGLFGPVRAEVFGYDPYERRTEQYVPF